MLLLAARVKEIVSSTTKVAVVPMRGILVTLEELVLARCGEKGLEGGRSICLMRHLHARVCQEAHEFFPYLNMKHVNRPRHKGSNHGTVWEDQTPSRDPASAFEVIVMMATFELAQECSAIVWGQSGFAAYVYNQVSETIALCMCLCNPYSSLLVKSNLTFCVSTPYLSS